MILIVGISPLGCQKSFKVSPILLAGSKCLWLKIKHAMTLIASSRAQRSLGFGLWALELVVWQLSTAKQIARNSC